MCEERKMWDPDEDGYYWYRVFMYSDTNVDWAFFRIREGGYETGEPSDNIQHMRMLEGLMQGSSDHVRAVQCSLDDIPEHTEYYTIEFGLDVKWPKEWVEKHEKR